MREIKILDYVLSSVSCKTVYGLGDPLNRDDVYVRGCSLLLIRNPGGTATRMHMRWESKSPAASYDSSIRYVGDMIFVAHG